MKTDQIKRKSILDEEYTKYLKWLILLHELNQEKNREHFERLVQALLAKNGFDDDLDASAEDLAKIDIEFAHEHLEIVKSVAPEFYQNVEDRISNHDAAALLKRATYDVFESGESKLPMGFLENIQVLMAKEEIFPNPKEIPLEERLRAAKENVMAIAESEQAKAESEKGMSGLTSAMSSDKGKLAMSSVMFSIALGIGSGAAIPIAATAFGIKLIQNEHVQKTMTEIDQKLTQTLIKFGFKKEVAEERRIPLGEKMKAFSQSKWFKRAQIPLAACSILLGVGGITMMATGIGMDDIAEIASKIGSADPIALANQTYEAISNSELVENASGFAHDTAHFVVSGQFLNVAQDVFENTKDFLNSDHAIESAKNSLGTAIGETSEFVSDKIVSAKEAITGVNEVTNEIAANGIIDICPAPAQITSSMPIDLGEEFNNIFGTSAFGAESDNFRMVESIEQPEIPNAIVTEHIVKSGDNLWNIAENHYKTITGNEPTPQQIVAMINDLGIENPNHINIGQTIEMPNDLSKYAGVDHVSASWLPKEIVADASPISAETEELTVVPIYDQLKGNPEAIDAFKQRLTKRDFEGGFEI